MGRPGICRRCEHYGSCTKSKKGRQIVRIPLEEVKERFEAQYAALQEIYARRKARVEHPFGHIKRNLKVDSFLLRGREGVNAETSLMGTCFNLARMITLFGVAGVIAKLRIYTSSFASLGKRMSILIQGQPFRFPRLGAPSYSM